MESPPIFILIKTFLALMESGYIHERVPQDLQPGMMNIDKYLNDAWGFSNVLDRVQHLFTFQLTAILRLS